MKTYYVITNTCDIDRLSDLGELCIVLDADENPIWGANHNDNPVDLDFAIPWDLLEKINKYSKVIETETENYIEFQISKESFESLEDVSAKLAKTIIKFAENENLV